MNLIAWTDGGGVSTASTEAYIGVRVANRDTGEVLCEHSGAIGKVTSNEAEYTAVLFAVYWAIEHGGTDLLITSDSQLVVRQINGQYRVSKPHLAEYLQEIRSAIQDLSGFKIEWVPREQNSVADELSRVART